MVVAQSNCKSDWRAWHERLKALAGGVGDLMGVLLWTYESELIRLINWQKERREKEKEREKTVFYSSGNYNSYFYKPFDMCYVRACLMVL